MQRFSILHIALYDWFPHSRADMVGSLFTEFANTSKTTLKDPLKAMEGPERPCEALEAIVTSYHNSARVERF